jgi:hypothetical protein
MQDSAEASALLRPAAAGVLGMHPVSQRVNAPRHEDASLIEPVPEDEADRSADADGKGEPAPPEDGGLFG